MREKLNKLINSKLTLENGTSWSIGKETKEFILNSEFTSSAETGIGYSTFIFAYKSKTHSTFFPVKSVEQEIRNHAEKSELKVDNVDFIVGKSQDTLPSFNKKIDFALIDGEHMFPCPLIDFYYLNQKLEVNGKLLVDDMQIPSVRLLHDFLSKESLTWELEEVLDNGRMCVYKKLKHNHNEWWGSQIYNKKMINEMIQKPKKLKMI